MVLGVSNLNLWLLALLLTGRGRGRAGARRARRRGRARAILLLFTLFVKDALDLPLLGLVDATILTLEGLAERDRLFKLAATTRVVVAVARTSIKYDPILEVPVENNIDSKLLNRGNEDEVLIAIAILLKLHIVGEEGVDEALVLVLKAAQELLPLLKTLLAVGHGAINLSKDTVNVFRSDRTTSTVFTVLSFANALSHFMRPGKKFFYF